MTEDLKRTVSRGYTRKINPSNHGIKNAQYESVDFFANYSMEFPAVMASEKVVEESEKLFQLAKGDVENAVAEYLMGKIEKIPRKKIITNTVSMSNSRANSTLDFINDLEGGLNDLGESN